MVGEGIAWDITTLDDLTQEGSPITYGVVKPGDEGVVPFIRGGDIAEGRVLEAQLRTISTSVSEQYRRTLLEGGEILVSLVGNPGQVAIAPPSLAGANIARQVGLVRLREDVDARFVSYFLRSPAGQQALGAQSLGSVQQVINLRDLKRVSVPLPPLPEQKRIAHVLGALDDKIELNRRMNATLEGISRALFKSWFVDFDPVRQKAAGKQPVGMDAQTAALFPDSFEDSEIGQVPKGWKIAALDEIADYLNGLALQKFPPGDGPTLPVIKIAQLRKGDTADADLCSDSVPDEYVVEDADVLFSWSGSLEVVVWCGGRGALNQHLFKVTSEVYPKWLYHQWTLHHLADFRLIAADKATTMGHIQRKHLTNAKVVVPGETTISGMARTMEPLMEQSISLRLESRTLAALRDTLLPKLLSGEIRIPEAEQAVDEAIA